MNRRAEPGKPIPDHVHGTTNGYNYWGCRCGPCGDAASAARDASRARAKEKPTPDDAHGTVLGFRYWGCRCGPCGDANAADCKARREEKQGDA